MMDSRHYKTFDNEDITKVVNPVEGMKYDTLEGFKIYGVNGYDTIREEQITWYKNQITDPSVESTIIAHMPIIQYAYAYEDYLVAKNSENQEKLNENAKKFGLAAIMQQAHFRYVLYLIIFFPAHSRRGSCIRQRYTICR